MAKRYATVLFLLVLLPTLVFAQNQPIRTKAPLVNEPVYTEYKTAVGTDIPLTAANYVAVDTMTNTYGPATATVNPLAIDPYSNIGVLLHRGNMNTYAVASGELWWNYTLDNGQTWTRSTTSVQNNTTANNDARYPSMTIFNPTHSTDIGDLWGCFSWPNLQASWADVGWGISVGLEISALAIIFANPPTLYGSNVPTFNDDTYIYWVSDKTTASDYSLDLWRTTDYSTVELITPPSWASDRWTNGNIALGGVTHNGVVYYGVTGSFPDTIGLGGWEVGYSKSTDNGATWTEWFVVDWLQIPATADYEELWDWKKGDAFVSYAGDIQVDKDGYVHILTALSDTANAGGTEFGYNAIVEFFETSEGVWDVKILAEGNDVHDNSFYGYPNGGTSSPGIGQCGPSFMIASNLDRDFMVAQWTIGTSATGDTLCDLFYSTRDLNSVLDGEWTASVNLTETDMMNEDGAHLAPFLASVVEGDTLVDYAYSMFWYEAGNTGYIIDPVAETVCYVAAVPVRKTGLVSVSDDVIVNKFVLQQNYPNPFNPGTQINYAIAERSNVTIKVYDVLGNEVATLVNTTQEAGAYDVNFDASQLSSGLYIYTLNAGNFTSSKKMMLLK